MYKIELTKTARKAYLKLPVQVRRIVFEKLEYLAENPMALNHNVTRLIDMKGYYRLRVGDWRVIYRIDLDTLVVEIIKVGHRKEIYQ